MHTTEAFLLSEGNVTTSNKGDVEGVCSGHIARSSQYHNRGSVEECHTPLLQGSNLDGIVHNNHSSRVFYAERARLE